MALNLSRTLVAIGIAWTCAATTIAGEPGCPEAGTVERRALRISYDYGGFIGTPNQSNEIGRGVASLGDLNGDGFNDLAMGSLDNDGGVGGGASRGAVWILFLDGQGRVIGEQKISDTQGGFAGILDDGDNFGGNIANIGDLDGDGVTDLAAGAIYDDDGGDARGAVWILFLNSDGTVKGHQKISDTFGGFTGTLDDEDWFGRSIASIGDLDRDGVNDIAVGAARDDDGGTDKGAVWILFLNSDGTVKGHEKISAARGGFQGGLDNDDWFGISLASPGDLDNDNIPDLAVGALDDDGGAQRGAIWILFLNNDGTVSSHQKISDTTGGFNGTLQDEDRFGLSLANMGDLDGDGVTDLAAGAPFDAGSGNDRGAVWILLLNPDGTVKHESKVSDLSPAFSSGGPSNLDRFGSWLASLGDPNGEGIVRLAASAPNTDNSGNSGGGAVWILAVETCFSPPAIFSLTPNEAMLLPVGGDHVAYTVTATGQNTLLYQWFRDGIPLTDGGHISGANSPTLSLLATEADEGFYTVEVSNEFGSELSSERLLAVRASCPGDFDGNGTIDLADLNAILAGFGLPCP